MSLVLGYADRESAIIMSDGRARGEYFISEDYNKTRKIGQNIILGFVGGKEPAEYFLDCVNQSLNVGEENCFAEEFLEVVEYGMERVLKSGGFDATFLIIGRKLDGGIVVSMAGKGIRGGFAIREVTEPRMQHIGGCISHEAIGGVYSENMRNADMPIFECMRKTIMDVSVLDNSINTAIFVQTL